MQAAQQNSNNYMPKLAIFPFGGLGDGLVYLVLAQNLSQQNCHVTVYHELLYKLKNIFPTFNILKAPETNQIDDILETNDLCIFNHNVVTSKYQINSKRSLAHKLIAFNSDYGTLQTTDEINNLINAATHHHPLIRRLLNNHGFKLTHHDIKSNVVNNIVDFCNKQLQIESPQKHVPYHCDKLNNNSYKNAIIVHPDSSIYKKNWSPKKYLKLAKRITETGEIVVFSVSPQEYKKWHAIIGGQYNLAQWSLEELANHLKQAKLFIGSDSGPGHLASLLGVPTITIFARKRNYYPWRPGWSTSYIATPRIKINFIRTKTHIRSWLSVKHAYSIYQQALKSLIKL